MKKRIKRFISISMVIVLMFIISIPVMASSIQPRIDFFATVKIVAYEGRGLTSFGSGYYGHAFIVVTNTANYEITVGHMPVPVGESITIGTFGN